MPCVNKGGKISLLIRNLPTHNKNVAGAGQLHTHPARQRRQAARSKFQCTCLPLPRRDLDRPRSSFPTTDIEWPALLASCAALYGKLWGTPSAQRMATKPIASARRMATKPIASAQRMATKPIASAQRMATKPIASSQRMATKPIATKMTTADCFSSPEISGLRLGLVCVLSMAARTIAHDPCTWSWTRTCASLGSWRTAVYFPAMPVATPVRLATAWTKTAMAAHVRPHRLGCHRHQSQQHCRYQPTKSRQHLWPTL